MRYHYMGNGFYSTTPQCLMVWRLIFFFFFFLYISSLVYYFSESWLQVKFNTRNRITLRFN